MHSPILSLCVYCGPFSLLLFFIGFAIAGFFPPLPPSTSAFDVAELYQKNQTVIQLGCVFMVASGAFTAPFTATLSEQLSRMEGQQASVLSKTQLALGATGIMMFLIEAMFWAIASYRVDRSPELTLLLSDIAWFWTVMPFSLIFLQALTIGTAILADKGIRPVFPRWLAFFNFWAAMMYVPGVLMVFFKSGPFAWNGILAFWIPASFYLLWFTIMARQTLLSFDQTAIESEK